jgi:signal transduction histidine kinase
VPRGVRGRLTLLVVVAILPGFVLALYGAADARRRDRVEAQLNASRLARLAAIAHERSIDSGHQLLLALSQIHAVTAAAGERCSSELRRIRDQSPRFLTIGRVDMQGKVVCSAVGDGQPDVGGSTWFEKALHENAFAISSLERDVVRGKPGLVLAQGFLGADGDRGVLFAALDPVWLSELVSAMSLPAGTSVNLIDRDGVIVARHPDPAAWVGRKMRTAPLGEAALDQWDDSAEAIGLEDDTTLFGLHRLQYGGDTGLALTVGIPRGDAFGAANRRTAQNLLFLSVTALIALAVTWYGSEYLILRKVDRLVRVVRRMGTGDLSARADLPADSGDEMSELATAFDKMAWNLQTRESDARQAAEALRALAVRIEAIREQERTAIAREIHDELGQHLTALRMDVDWVMRAMDSSTRTPQIERKLTSMVNLLDETVPMVRGISRRLRPGVLDALGLRAAIDWQLEDFQQRTGTHSEFVGDLDDSRLRPDRATALFRILQEALTNIIRHARARSVTIHLTQDDGLGLLEVMDDGCGIPEAAVTDPRALGLLGMRERAAAVGGQLTITGRFNNGTTISVWMPLEPENKHDSTD